MEWSEFRAFFWAFSQSPTIPPTEDRGLWVRDWKIRLIIHVTLTNVPFFDPSPKFAIRSKAVHSWRVTPRVNRITSQLPLQSRSQSPRSSVGGIVGLWENAEKNQPLIGCLIISLTHSLLIEIRALPSVLDPIVMECSEFRAFFWAFSQSPTIPPTEDRVLWLRDCCCSDRAKTAGAPVSTSYPGHFTSHVGENGRSHDTLNFGVFSTIIHIGKIYWQNSYTISRFVDHYVLKIYGLSKEQKMKILNKMYISPYMHITRLWPIKDLNLNII